jgi:hypothetical protein
VCRPRRLPITNGEQIVAQARAWVALRREFPGATISLRTAAAFERFADEVLSQRGQAVPNALHDSVGNLVEHYEQWGRLMVKMLAEEATTPSIRPALAAGRDYHRRWCETVLSGSLASLADRDRDRRLAQLVTICDLRTWEMLRITSQLSRAQTELALLELLESLVTRGK